MKIKQGDGQMTDTYNEKLAEIIRLMQEAHKEFEALEAKLAAREAKNANPYSEIELAERHIKDLIKQRSALKRRIEDIQKQIEGQFEIINRAKGLIK